MGNRQQVDFTVDNGHGSLDRSTTTSTPNALNQLTSITTAVAGGPTTSANLLYDAAGNLTQSAAPNGTNKTVYTYDDADRLSRIERRGDAGQLLTISEFAYDYASRRAFSREYDFANGGWANPQVKRRVFDGLDVVQERDSNNQVTAQLVRDGNIGGILSRTTAQGAAFYGYDGNGNVTLLTDGAGQDVGRYRYDAFGQALEIAGPRAGENPYRFSTKELHAASGLYDYGYRFYSPGMGRWINRDPIQEAGGVNLYAMVKNNPVNKVDRYGLDPGFKFNTAEEAAYDVLRFINSTSIRENLEYAGLIYIQDFEGKLYYFATDPLPGSIDRSDADAGVNHMATDNVPFDVVGDYHTHGDYSAKDRNGNVRRVKTEDEDTFSSNFFSDIDRDRLEYILTSIPNFKSYLGTPGGKFKTLDSTGRVTQLKDTQTK